MTMDESKGQRQDLKARRRSLLQSSRQVGRRFFLKVAGLGLAHFALINAAAPKEALADTCVAPVSDTCEALLGYHLDSCNPSAGDADQCFGSAPYDPDDECKQSLGDVDHCDEAGYSKVVDTCKPRDGDPDQCHPGQVGSIDLCDPSIGDIDVCEFKVGEPVIKQPATAVPPEGGTADDGEGTKVVFPPGALSAPTYIYIGSASFENHQTTEDGKRIVVAREFAPHGLELNVPVQLTIPVSPGEAVGLDGDSLGLYVFDDPTSSWQPIPPALCVKEGSSQLGYTIKMQVNHFSFYGIGGSALPPAPVPASKNWALALLGFLGLAILGRFGWWREEKPETGD